MDKKPNNTCQDNEVRKGPWTMEEDLILINYIANHGEGVWNSLAQSAGLKRTGKSCRLRWLNYLRPDVRRGNISPEEELLIMELHAKWGNRWSKIAKHLPGRTDNEIKNYWRTRIQKHLKHTQSTSGNSSHSSDHGHDHHTSSSQISTSSAPSTSTAQFMTTNNNHHPYFPSISTPSSCPNQAAMDATAYMTMVPQSHPTEAGNFWGTVDEDLWSMQLFNGD